MPARSGYALLLSLLLHALVLQGIERSPPASRPPATADGNAVAGLDARLQSGAEADIRRPRSDRNDTAEAVEAATQAAAPGTGTQAAPGRGGAAAGDSLLYYFKASELDRRPFPLQPIEIPDPQTREGGSVHIRILVSESGRVDHASIVMSTGLADLEQSALGAFSSARFRPGYRGKIPVRSEMVVEVNAAPAGPAGMQPLPP